MVRRNSFLYFIVFIFLPLSVYHYSRTRHNIKGYPFGRRRCRCRSRRRVANTYTLLYPTLRFPCPPNPYHLVRPLPLRVSAHKRIRYAIGHGLFFHNDNVCTAADTHTHTYTHTLARAEIHFKLTEPPPTLKQYLYVCVFIFCCQIQLVIRVPERFPRHRSPLKPCARLSFSAALRKNVRR